MTSVHYTPARPRNWIDWTFWFALAVYVAVLPIGGTIALRNLALLILVAVTVWQVGHGKLRLHFPLFWPWASYGLVALVSLTYAASAAYSLSEIKSEFLYPLLIMIIAASWIRSAERFDRLVWLLVACNVLFVIGSAWSAWRYVAMVIHWGHSALAMFKGWTVWGAGAWTNGVGDTASTIVALLPIFVVLAIQNQKQSKPRVSLAVWALVAANVAALFLALNRQSWICLAVAMAVILALTDRAYWTRRRTLTAAAMATILVGLAFAQFQIRALKIDVPEESVLESVAPSVPGSSGGVPTIPADLVQPEQARQANSALARDPRLELWSFCLVRLAEHPWSGGGFGREAFKRSYPEFIKAHRLHLLWHAHNMVLNKGIQMGLPGIAAFLLLWGAALAATVRGLRQPRIRHWTIAVLAMMAGVFMRNMTDDFFIRDHAQMFWLVLGAFLGCSRQLLSSEDQAIDQG